MTPPRVPFRLRSDAGIEAEHEYVYVHVLILPIHRLNVRGDVCK
jgi:hypothetical protein